jgi:hypothetical protein
MKAVQGTRLLLFCDDFVQGTAIGIDRRLRIRFSCLIAKLNSKGAAAMSEYLNEMLGYSVQGTAEWRREKARQFPDDIRNIRAAEQLDKLAAEIDALEDSQIETQISEAHDAINSFDDGDGWAEINEALSEELRLIAFHSNYSTGIELLEWYRDLLREKHQDLIDEVVPAPDLDEQVADDPAVKAAKQAYDEARAKAYTEARKRL